ncbi:hypothetical protein WK80_20355 [Burkholderia multivorans]|uniref:Uncharacterized protein n=1 Tax=Burkholderia multivorans TaxID=87883 RepID=A0A8E2RT43_9BURK|nr:hypothetical protein A8H40_24360 [Burkholderia multivorans]KOE26731.1 hypothetical protein AI46_06640 [Burkholderia multivorans R-20526]AYY97630.1 hypothetical protein EGY19_09285 [Burkholderia multivorans]KVR41285.1 hypothetical protein WK17_20095 [Burkholderia multivorans]KVV23708.1 hypothetical protein WK80_20355 [Burkholderia multivorans]
MHEVRTGAAGDAVIVEGAVQAQAAAFGSIMQRFNELCMGGTAFAFTVPQRAPRSKETNR